MKTRNDCFAELRKLFVDANPAHISQIEREADHEAAALGLERNQFISEQINLAFGRYLNTLPGDTTVSVIEMMTTDEHTRKALLREYYQEIAESLGMSAEDFLRENRITL
ncbi:DUF6388 family protein [Lelliottia wanjuensis]|uniref:DUF6388 family protein n=1 Tax=Lelliottia wanjuensis TaxID=3050585 RepID=UPI00254F6013|nr:DUF6388 family protein [Lelliottia sp. V104_15]MDK9605524.1 DUF6388 family protein [Lelliottia sp. V104_15]